MTTAPDIVREGAVRPITRGRRLVIHAALAVIILGHLYDIARQQEHWPFSNYPMWARLSTDWHVKAVVPVGLTDSYPPGEVPLMEEAYFAPMPLQYQRLTFQSVARSPRRAGERDKVLGDYLRHYEGRRGLGLHGGPPLLGLRLYEHTWDMDTRASNTDTPRRTALMYEYQPGGRNSPALRPRQCPPRRTLPVHANAASATEPMQETPSAFRRVLRLAAERWNRFWFEPYLPTDLGVCRVLVYGLLFAYYLPVSHVGWGSIPASWREPLWIFDRLHLPIFSDEVLRLMVAAWKVSLLLSCVGLVTRVSTAIAFVLGAYLIGLPYNFGKTDHMTALVVFTLGIMALSWCGDAWSADAFLRRRFGRKPPPPPSGEYRWPVRAVWLTMALIFFAAGVAKLASGGLAWVLSDHFSISLVQQHYGPNPPSVTWGLFIARHPWIAHAMAASSILIELSAPLALFSRRLRWVVPPLLLTLQLGIAVIMNVWFTRFMFVYVFWVPWGLLLPRRLQSA